MKFTLKPHRIIPVRHQHYWYFCSSMPLINLQFKGILVRKSFICTVYCLLFYFTLSVMLDNFSCQQKTLATSDIMLAFFL